MGTQSSFNLPVRVGILAGAFALTAFSGCNCDEVLGSSAPAAVLAFGADETPPLARLEVGAGAVTVGQHSPLAFTLKSTGTLGLVVTSAILGPDTADCPTPSGAFRVDVAPPQTLAPGKSAPITVTFSPQDGAPGCAALLVTTNDPEHPTLEALITGQGDAAALCTDRAIVDFGDVLVGETKDDVVTLTSCGTRPVNVSAITENSFFPPFAADLPALPAALAPGSSVDVPVHFSPTAPGRHSIENANAGLLTVETDLAGQLFQVALIGNGKNPPACIIDVVPSVLNFGFVQASTAATSPVIVRNLGELPCTLTGIALRDGVDEFSFSASAFTAGMTLAPLAILTVDVTFTAPSAESTVDNALEIDSDDPVHGHVEVPLQGAVPSDTGCFVRADPLFVDFGAVQVNTLRAREVTVTNIGSDPCFLKDTTIAAGSDPGFIDTSSNFGLVAPGATKTLTVGYRPTSPVPSAHGTFRFNVSDQPFLGTNTSYDVPLQAFTGDPGICVVPRRIDFGETTTPATQTFQVSACAASTVTVTALDFTLSDAEITLTNPPTLPRTLAPGDAFTVTVRYAPTDTGGDTAQVMVRSNDLVAPAIPVDITGGHTIVPPSAGRFLYFWQIPAPGIVGGDIMKLPLQGNPAPQPFWGPRNGKQCAGCHSISPDGKYVAVVELGSMRFVEADTNLELFLGNTQFLDPTSFSWRPNINTQPPYQFAYGDGQDVRIGSLFDGEIGVLNGANDGTLIDTMPSWGTNGKIAFVRGAQEQTSNDGSSFGLAGPTDIFIVDETGGTPVPMAGGSANGMANYYPAYSPNGLWLAFTQSPSASSTIAADDARIRMATADNSGTILTLDALNTTTGPTSYTTWSVDGAFLSFASKRAGGAGDWDLYLGSIDPLTGTDGNLRAITEVNTSDFEHAAQWSP